MYSLDLQLVVRVGRDLIKMSAGPSQSINKCSITLMSTSFSLSADNGHILCFYFDIWPLWLKGKKEAKESGKARCTGEGEHGRICPTPLGTSQREIGDRLHRAGNTLVALACRAVGGILLGPACCQHPAPVVAAGTTCLTVEQVFLFSVRIFSLSNDFTSIYGKSEQLVIHRK